ncbi:MAG: DoxX family protein [Candidatus Limnocylindrales bacterium]
MPVAPRFISSASGWARQRPCAKSVARTLTRRPRWPDTLARWSFAAFFTAAGIAHFVFPAPFVAHLPPTLPGRLPIVYATGLIEIALAGLLLGVKPPRRGTIAVVIAIYLVAVFPGTLYVALAQVPVYPHPWMAWARLPLQPLFVLWALRAVR